MSQEEQAVETYTIIGPGDGPFVPSISVRMEPEPEQDSVEAAAEAEAKALAAMAGVQVLERTSDFLQEQHPQEEILICWVVEGEVMFQRRHHVLVEDTGYTLVLTFQDESGLGSYPEGEEVLRAFVPGEELRWEGSAALTAKTLELEGDGGPPARLTARLPEAPLRRR